MQLFKNASQTWLPLGKLGPFPLIDDDDHKDNKENGQRVDVHVVECQPSNILNIHGSQVIRLEPERFIFTKDNLTKSLTATMNVSLHASFPLNLTVPKSYCQIWNRTWEEHSIILQGQHRNFTFLLQSVNDNHEVEDDEWMLVSHFGPLTTQYRPKENTTNIYTCKASKKGLKVQPYRFIWDRTNSSQALYVPHYVHTSYPDDEPIPPPKCFFRRNKPILLLSESVAERTIETSIEYSFLTLILMGLLLLVIAIGSYFYLFPPPNPPPTKEENDDDDNNNKHHNNNNDNNNNNKRLPLTFSQQLVQRLQQTQVDSNVSTIIATQKNGWARVLGPGDQDLAIQWTDKETFVTKLIPKETEEDKVTKTEK